MMPSTIFDQWNFGCFPRAKHVQYSKICHVILIPTIQEFREAGIANDIWDIPPLNENGTSNEYFRDSPIPTEEELQYAKDETDEETDCSTEKDNDTASTAPSTDSESSGALPSSCSLSDGDELPSPISEDC